MRRWFWLAVALVWIAVALGAGATSAIRERRAREERLAVLRHLQLEHDVRSMLNALEDQERYLQDIVQYQRRWGEYLENKMEGRFDMPPIEPIRPVTPFRSVTPAY